MHPEDLRFADLLLDAGRRDQAVRGWARSRRLSFLASVLFLLLAAAALVARIGMLCGLFAGVSAINFAVATAADLKIKLAALALRLQGPPPALGVNPSR